MVGLPNPGDGIAEFLIKVSAISAPGFITRKFNYKIFRQATLLTFFAITAGTRGVLKMYVRSIGTLDGPRAPGCCMDVASARKGCTITRMLFLNRIARSLYYALVGARCK